MNIKDVQVQDQTTEEQSELSNYFGALPPDDLIDALDEKIKDYYEFANRYGFMQKWKDGYSAYFGISASGANSSQIVQSGANGENIIIKVNQYRSLLQNLLTMTTATRPAWQPKAANTDSKSLNQAVLARSILDYYMYEAKLDAKLKQACEFALFAGESFVSLNWNQNTGEQIGVSETGAPLHEGDLEFKVFHPVDCVRDPYVGSEADSQWKILRNWKNRYDILAKYPEYEDEIMSCDNKMDAKNNFAVYDTKGKSDLIPIYTFMHRESEALPGGRYVEFLAGSVVLLDSPLPYKGVPVFRIASGDFSGTCMGYSTAGYDLLGPQKYYDTLHSIIATNQINLGTTNILASRGSGLEASNLGSGMNWLEYDHTAGPAPQVLDLAKTDPQLFQNIDRIQGIMQTISGVNAVARGQVDKEMSGSALALIASQAVTFNSGLQNSYNSLLEAVGGGIISILQVYCQSTRLASIGGRSNRSRVKEYKGSDLDGIQRVTVEAVNPLSKTAAGRLTLADNMLKSGFITNAKDYMLVVETGNLETLLESDTSEILMIKSENEDLSEGKSATALVVDDHALHVKEHSVVLNSPESRQDPAIIQAVLTHIQQHLDLARNIDPGLAQILGHAVIAPKAPPASAIPGPAVPQMMNPQQPVQVAAGEVKGPRMPSLPPGAPPEAANAYAQVKQNS